MVIILNLRMSKQKKLNHAIHNKNVCDFLSSEDNYVDWVITTAFYSSIHFVDHKLFPIKVNEENGNKLSLKCINDFKRYYNISQDKHSVRADLVQSNCNQIHNSFNWLRSLSSTARYSDYIFPKPSSLIQQVKAQLDLIDEYCKK